MSLRAQTCVLATRRSRLALTQTRWVARAVNLARPVWVTAELGLVTTGDREGSWSLEERGGKGLFTKEVEEAVLDARADLAVHSLKDLPTTMAGGLALGAVPAREDPRDVLVLRADTAHVRRIATGSPRRRAQLAATYPDAEFTELRGNVETRLGKLAAGAADATVLAAAGLNRLGVTAFEGLEFRILSTAEMVPAPGQGALGVQCRAGEEERYAFLDDAESRKAVFLERAFLAHLGGGCHSAVAAHFDGAALHVFEAERGRATWTPQRPGASAPELAAEMVQFFEDWARG